MPARAQTKRPGSTFDITRSPEYCHTIIYSTASQHKCMDRLEPSAKRRHSRICRGVVSHEEQNYYDLQRKYVHRLAFSEKKALTPRHPARQHVHRVGAEVDKSLRAAAVAAGDATVMLGRPHGR